MLQRFDMVKFKLIEREITVEKSKGSGYTVTTHSNRKKVLIHTLQWALT